MEGLKGINDKCLGSIKVARGRGGGGYRIK